MHGYKWPINSPRTRTELYPRFKQENITKYSKTDLVGTYPALATPGLAESCDYGAFEDNR